MGKALITKLVVLLGVFTLVNAGEARTVLYVNGVIWTGDPAQPWAEAMWVEDGVLRGVGESLGFANVASGPMVRSSYHAEHQARPVLGGSG